MVDENDDATIVEVEKDVLPINEVSEIVLEEVDSTVDEIIVEMDENEIVEMESENGNLTDIKNGTSERRVQEEFASPVLQSDLLTRRRITKREKEERRLALTKERARKRRNSGGANSQSLDLAQDECPVDRQSFIERVTEHPVFDERFYNRVYDLPFAILQQRRSVPKSVLCRSTPRLFLDGGTGGDISFLIDTCVPVSDLLVDNLGKWTRQGMRTTTRTLYVNDRTICRKGEHDYIVEKRYGIHGNCLPDRSIRKVAWTMRTAFGDQLYSLISYRILDGATVPFKAHGNAKSPAACVYQRILPSSIEKMKTLRKTLTPKDITMRMVRSAGGLSSVTDSQALPRNDKQLYNLSRYRCPASLNCGPSKAYKKKITSLEFDQVIHNPGSGFVQFSERTASGQRVFCATQSMIINFKNSCTESITTLEQRQQCLAPPPDYSVSEMSEFYYNENLIEYSRSGPSILIIDQTYDLHDMFLTVFSYHNIRFVRRSNLSRPLCIAAFLLSSQKEEEDYLWAANCLWTLCGSDKGLRVRAFLTDTSSVVDKLKMCPLFDAPSIHIRCGVRLMRTTKLRLRELGANETLCARILRQIYGQECSEVFIDGLHLEYGLIDCVCMKHYHNTLDYLSTNWTVKGFTEFFSKNQSEMVSRGFLMPERIRAGLGRGGTASIMNEVRGLNGMLKRYIKQNEEVGFHAMIQSLESFTKAQFVRLGEAIFGLLGEFDLAPEFKHLWMDERTWKNLSTADKKAALFSIGIVEDDVEPECTIPLQSELPTSLQSIYTLHEWRKLMNLAKNLVNRNEVKCFDEEFYAVRDVAIVHTVQLISDDVFRCSCNDKRPICTHNLSVSIAKQCVRKFVDRVGERKDYLAASLRKEGSEHLPSGSRKRLHREVSPEFKVISSSELLHEKICSDDDVHDIDSIDGENEHIIVENVDGDVLGWIDRRNDPRFQIGGVRVSRRPQRELRPIRRFSPSGYRTLDKEIDNTRDSQKIPPSKGAVRRCGVGWLIAKGCIEEEYQVHRFRISEERTSDADEAVCQATASIKCASDGLNRDKTERNNGFKRETSSGEEDDKQAKNSIIEKNNYSLKMGPQKRPSDDDEEEQEVFEEGIVDFDLPYSERDIKNLSDRPFSDRITSHPVFDEKFYSRVYDVPVAILQKNREVSPHIVCKDAPMIYLDGLTGGNVSFLVDSTVPVSYLLADNLGKWNGPNLRCTTRTLYLNSKTLCGKGEHDYILEKRYSIHANTRPERGIKKVIWTMRTATGEQLYSLVSYRIDDHAIVPNTSYPASISFPSSSCYTFYDSCDEH